MIYQLSIFKYYPNLYKSIETNMWWKNFINRNPNVEGGLHWDEYVNKLLKDIAIYDFAPGIITFYTEEAMIQFLLEYN